jgi:hypothetical protein
LNLHAQLFGLVQLVAGAVAVDDAVGFFADAAAGLAAELDDRVLDALADRSVSSSR